MSTVYTGKGGKEYEYHDQFHDTSKDLVIISSDNLALRVDSNLLKTHSSIFRAMFSTCDKDNNFVHLDHSSDVLALYLNTIDDQPIDLSKTTWDDFKATVELCIRYDTPSFGPKLFRLFKPINRFGAETGYTIFLLASKFDDILTACRVIGTCAYFRDGERTGQDLFWKKKDWPRELVEPLPCSWAWAYTRSHMDLGSHSLSSEYWIELSGKFMKYLLP